MNPLLEQFLQEARENLAFIDQNIGDISSGDEELLNSVFRAAHTLKGGSGIVGFESVKQITHHAEDLLDQVRAKKLAYNKEIEAALYDAFDEVMNLIEAAEEREDIVQADEARVEKIVQTLNTLMGKDGVKAAWVNPMRIADENTVLVNATMPFLEDFQSTIAFEYDAINESNINDLRLYAILFDVDENCMLYGNDPLYALSLLGEKVQGISTCMRQDSIRMVLDGTTQDDLLQARMMITAYVHATYEEIEEALFNFIDDLLFAPLDIATLLNITQGEKVTLDVMIDFAKHGVAKCLDGNMNGLDDAITETLTLIGSDTLQARRLHRLKALLGHIPVEACERMVGFFEALNSGAHFAPDVYSVPSQPLVAVKEVSQPSLDVPEESHASSEVIFSNQDRTMMTLLLKQQLVALRKFDDPALLKRVEALITRPLQAMGYPFHAGHSSHESLIEALESILHGTHAAPKEQVKQIMSAQVSTSQPQAQTKPQDEIKSVEVTKPEERNTLDSKKNIIGKTVKIEQESIDHLMNIVGELLVAKNSLPYLADNVGGMDKETVKRSILEKYSFINRLSMQLQDLIMGMRMLPISYVFDRYPKLVRDISKNLGKKVTLTMEGGETKLDKNMIEMLADPMIHIMRNSLDHGIELPEVREKNGKPSEGIVKLNAYPQSDKIIVTIQDDGAGINVERVINKVLEKGLLSLEAIEKMNDNEKAELVLIPGLSTADTITEYSGRGVGMDVVKKSIEGFGGTIGIRTQSGQGTTITLSIPVSLAVTSLLHVSMGGVHYGFPMESVSETVKINQDEVAILHNEPFVYLRGDVVPLLYIKQMLDFKAIGTGPLSLVVLNIKGNLLAVVVNELLGQLDVVQKPLEGVIDNHPLFSGTALLGNGQIIMVIDQDGLLSMSHTLKEDFHEAV